MGRLPRVYIEGVLYYVTSQSGHHQDLFVSPSDYQDYISLMANYKKQYGFKLFSYVLMPTHLHMLIELRHDVSISNIMHDINSLYTKNFNSRYAKKGHLFQERFKALLAEKGPYLLPIIRHIHLSPKRAKIVEDPKDYPYSSHSQFLNPEKRQYPDIAEEIEEVFGVLEGREKAFEEYVAGSEEKEDFRKSIRKKSTLGSKAFKEQIKKAIEETIREQKRAPFPQKKHMVYMALGGIVVLVLGVTVASFYRRQHVALRTTYDKTLAVYDSTLEMLKQERDRALKADKDIEGYMWKIRLTEQAAEDLKREREEALRLQQEIEGYKWDIKLTQTAGLKMNYNPEDVLIIEGNQVASRNLLSVGFYRSKYSKRVDKNGVVTWETMQNDGKGAKATWRGEWDGEVMKGVMRRTWADGTIRDFKFVSAGKRVRR